MGSQLVDLEYDALLHETQKAYLFLFDKKEIWIPKSMAELDTRKKQVTVPATWAINKGIENHAV